MEQSTFTATTMTTGSGEIYNLNETVFYCLQQTELQDMANHLFDKAYQKLEKTLLFATGLGVFIGMLIIAILK